MPFRKYQQQSTDERSGRRHLIQLSALINAGLFAVINILLVALLNSDNHTDPSTSAYYTLRVFVWTNAIAALITAVVAPVVSGKIQDMQHRLARQNKELRSLHAIDTAISAELNLSTILDVAVRNATVTIDGEFGALWLFADPDHTVVDAEAFYNVPPSLRPLVKEVVVDRANEESVDPWSLDNPTRRDGMESTWGEDKTGDALKLRNLVTVPVKHQDRSIGVVMVANHREIAGQPAGFATEDEDLLTAIATTIGVAVQNSRLYAETERRGVLLRSLVARLGDAVSASSDASLLMQVLADEAKRILACSRVAVYEFDDAMESFLPLAASYDTGGPSTPLDLFYRQPLDMDIVLPPEAEAPNSDRYSPNIRAQLGLSPDFGLFLDSPGFLFVLRSRDHDCIGLLCMLDVAQRPYSEDEWAFAQALAAQAAVALENARLSERTHALLAQARALQDATNKIAAELDIDRVLEGVMESARSVLTADGYAIWNFDPEEAVWHKRAGHGLDFGQEPSEAGEGTPRELDALQYVLREQSALVIPNTAHAPLASTLSLAPKPEKGWYLEQGLRQPWTDGEQAKAKSPNREGSRHHVRALLALPLVHRGKTTGVMALYYRTPHTFIPDEVGLAQSFAHQAANALQNASMFTELNALYKREKRIAGELQRSLLPPIPPEVGKFNVAYRYQAGLDEAVVGGDFLDLFFLGPNLMGLVIADVSGKGLPAAVQTAMIKYTLRAFAGEMPRNPADVLERVNNTLCNRSTGIQGFVTLFYGVLDAQNGVLTYANAGHEMPLLCDGETGWVCGIPVADGIALGCMPDMDFQNRTVILDPKSTLLMYTDGITEARNAHGDFLGLEGLRRIMSCGGGDAEAAIQEIYDAVDEYAGDSLRDDVAMLLVQRKIDEIT